MGHLEASAAAGGLASLVVAPLVAGVVATNAQLRLSASSICRVGTGGDDSFDDEKIASLPAQCERASRVAPELCLGRGGILNAREY